TIVAPPSIEYRPDAPASPVLGEMVFQQKVSRQLIDGALYPLRRDEKRLLGRGRCRHVCHRAVTTIIDPIVAILTVPADIGAVRDRKRPISGELAVNFRMTREIDEDARQSAGVEIRRDRVAVSALLYSGPIRQYV